MQMRLWTLKKNWIGGAWLADRWQMSVHLEYEDDNLFLKFASAGSSSL